MFDGTPVYFKQSRLGQYGNPFTCYKFKTILNKKPKDFTLNGNKKIENGYMSCLGYFLRVTSIDELPQLVNVLKGEMSIVGPRPLILSEKFVHKERQRLGIYNLRPGLTGLAQVSGRNALSDAEKIALDYKYLKECSFMTDFKICIKTIFVIFSRKGIFKKG